MALTLLIHFSYLEWVILSKGQSYSSLHPTKKEKEKKERAKPMQQVDLQDACGQQAASQEAVKASVSVVQSRPCWGQSDSPAFFFT